MIHYHGGPITPLPAAHRAWQGGHAFISYARPDQLDMIGAITQSFAVDNGAFSFWKSGRSIDWNDYYRWLADVINHPRCDFAIIPDVIDGSEAENDELIQSCPFPAHRMAPVWHINEPITRLIRLAGEYPRVCIGSSGVFDVKTPRKFIGRIKTAIRFICDEKDQPICKLHGLRMLNPKIFTRIPLSSADSTNIAMNIGKDKNWERGNYQPKSKETRAWVMRELIESHCSSEKLDWLSVVEIEFIRLMRSAGWSDGAIVSQYPRLTSDDIEGICHA